MALKEGQRKEQEAVNKATNQIKQYMNAPHPPSEQAFITFLEPYRKLLFSPVTDRNGSTLMEVAQEAYKKIIPEFASPSTQKTDNPVSLKHHTATSKPEWKKHHTREMPIPFRATVSKPKNKNNDAPSPSDKTPTASQNH